MDDPVNVTMKSRALGKEEVMYLLDLVAKHKILTSKSTNANSNRLKDDAWKSIAEEFNAMAGEERRRGQLRLKWENLKKNARKRNAIIRDNNKKAAGGKTYIIPNEALDRVTAMLNECRDSTVEGGGDGEDPLGPNVSEGDMDDMDSRPMPEELKAEQAYDATEDDNESAECSSGSDTNTLREFIFKTSKSSLNKRRKQLGELQRAKRDRNLAIAAYFQAKTEKVNLENVKLKLEIEQLKRARSGVTQIIISD